MQTEVRLLSLAGSQNVTLRFGRPDSDVLEAPGLRVVIFLPGEVFALVRWHGARGITSFYGLEILRAPWLGERTVDRPFVKPGALVLLRVVGWRKVEAVESAIQRVEDVAGRAELAAPDYWRHVAYRVAFGRTPRPYTEKQHQAWMKKGEQVRW